MHNPSIAIVTDSTADLPESLIDQNKIHVINNLIMVEGIPLEDGVGITREEFYINLPKMKTFPTTATASVGTYLDLYEKLFIGGFAKIISIHASSKLSGILNAATTAAQSFGERVRVIDSENISLGLGFQVIAAAEAALQQASLDSILALTENTKKRLRLVAMLNTLEYVRRSGRVNWAKARLGELLNIKAFLEVREGIVLSLGETRTYQKGITRLLEMIQSLGQLERLAILHTNAVQEARQILSQISNRLLTDPLIVNVTTVIGSHVGPNCVGFAAVKTNS